MDINRKVFLLTLTFCAFGFTVLDFTVYINLRELNSPLSKFFSLIYFSIIILVINGRLQKMNLSHKWLIPIGLFMTIQIVKLAFPTIPHAQLPMLFIDAMFCVYLTLLAAVPDETIKIESEFKKLFNIYQPLKQRDFFVVYLIPLYVSSVSHLGVELFSYMREILYLYALFSPLLIIVFLKRQKHANISWWWNVLLLCLLVSLYLFDQRIAYELEWTLDDNIASLIDLLAMTSIWVFFLIVGMKFSKEHAEYKFPILTGKVSSSSIKQKIAHISSLQHLSKDEYVTGAAMGSALAEIPKYKIIFNIDRDVFLVISRRRFEINIGQELIVSGIRSSKDIRVIELVNVKTHMTYSRGIARYLFGFLVFFSPFVLQVLLLVNNKHNSFFFLLPFLFLPLAVYFFSRLEFSLRAKIQVNKIYNQLVRKNGPVTLNT